MASKNPHPDIETVLFSAEEIRSRIKKISETIQKDYEGKSLLLVGVLKGSVIFLSDLVRQIDLACSIDFISVASYGDHAESSGAVRLTMDLRESPEGKDILLVEDILDTGLTMKTLIENLKKRHPRSLKICALLDKKENRKVKIDADYVGFNIPNKFVVGYGLDYAERYRNLPYIGALKKSIYADSH